ncbi:MAG: putative bifunctional diguanylate cyclase/phosphodiesterase [Microcystaceae cyanobacterium]
MNDPNLSEPTANILIVDDTRENLDVLAIMLKRNGYKVRQAINGKIALMGVQSSLPDLILLDIKMPDIDGYEVCRQLKSSPDTSDIPVIFLSALDEVWDKVQAFQVGGVDYITKPFQLDEVLARIKTHLKLRYLQKELQEFNQTLEERVKERTAELEYKALHDDLMGLPNRTLFLQQLQEVLVTSQQDHNYQFAVLFLDCDRFKIVNESFGHLEGDKLLKAVAHRINQCLSHNDLMARFGGDELAILMDNIGDPKTVIQLVEKIKQNLALPFTLNKTEIFLSVSIGMVLGNSTYQKPEDLLRDADIALYNAKNRGNGHYEWFDPQMYHRIQQKLQLDMDLRRALNSQEFLLYYQPIISLQNNQLVGFEALIRWQHPQKGMISPAKFIPVTEETGLIIPLGLWVLKEACHQLRQWQQQLMNNWPQLANLTMGVNLSIAQFAQPNLINQIDKILAETQLKSQYLKLEITETAIMDNAELTTHLLRELRQRKIRLCIDDFGTGYSSLSYLHRFPVDTLKIDRSFVSRLGEHGENKEIIQAIITLSQTLGMNVVAEGIETEQQKKQLQKLGCPLGQGYLFARPLAQDAALQFIKEHLLLSS